MLSTTCAECGKKVKLHPGSTVVYLYLKQPWFNFIEIICKCGQTSRLFADLLVVRSLLQDDCGAITEDFAEPEIVENYGSIYNKKLIQAHELTDREELYMQFYHYLMETRDAHVELGTPRIGS